MIDRRRRDPDEQPRRARRRTLTVSFNDGRHTQARPGTVIGTAAGARPRDHPRPARTTSIPAAARALVAAAARRRRARDRLPARPRRRPDRHPGHRLRARPHGARGRRPVARRVCCRPTPRSTRATPAARWSTPPGKLVGINTDRRERRQRRERRLRDLDRRGAPGDRRDPQQAGASQRAWIGVTFDSIASAAAAVQIGLPPDTRGAAVDRRLLREPRPRRPACSEGDVVVAIDGEAVRSAARHVEGARARASRATRSCSTSSTAPARGVPP